MTYFFGPVDQSGFYKGVALGYGLKFWPEEFQKLLSANPHIAIFAEEGKL